VHYSLPQQKVKELVNIVILPLQIGGFYIKNLPKEIYSQIKEMISLKQKNKELRQQVAQLLKEKKYWQEALVENKRLKSLLKFKDSLDYKVIPGKVIGYDPTNTNAVILIDKGKYAGVKKFSPIIAYQAEREILVGRVVNVGIYSSFVSTITDKSSMIGVETARTNVKGILLGKELNLCKLDYITKDQDVAIGDEIITSGDGDIFPKGILVGKINDINYNYNQQFLDIKVKPFLNLQKLNEIFVIIGD
jgi:rod shape-determining protein MreC